MRSDHGVLGTARGQAGHMPWGQVFQLDKKALPWGDTLESFFKVTLPKRPRCRFNYRTKAPANRARIRLLFQHDGAIVATAILLAKHKKDADSEPGSKGYLELEDPRWLDEPIEHDAFARKTGLVLSNFMHLLHDHEDWFLRRMRLLDLPAMDRTT